MSYIPRNTEETGSDTDINITVVDMALQPDNKLVGLLKDLNIKTNEVKNNICSNLGTANIADVSSADIKGNNKLNKPYLADIILTIIKLSDEICSCEHYNTTSYISSSLLELDNVNKNLNNISQTICQKLSYISEELGVKLNTIPPSHNISDIDQALKNHTVSLNTIEAEMNTLKSCVQSLNSSTPNINHNTPPVSNNNNSDKLY